MADEQKPDPFNSNSLTFSYSNILHVMVGFTGLFIPQIQRMGNWKEFFATFFRCESGSIIIQGKKPEHRFRFNWNFDEKRLTVTRVDENNEGSLPLFGEELPNQDILAWAYKNPGNEIVYDFTRDIEDWEKRNRVQRPT